MVSFSAPDVTCLSWHLLDLANPWMLGRKLSTGLNILIRYGQRLVKPGSRFCSQIGRCLNWTPKVKTLPKLNRFRQLLGCIEWMLWPAEHHGKVMQACCLLMCLHHFQAPWGATPTCMLPGSAGGVLGMHPHLFLVVWDARDGTQCKPEVAWVWKCELPHPSHQKLSNCLWVSMVCEPWLMHSNQTKFSTDFCSGSDRCLSLIFIPMHKVPFSYSKTAFF